MEFKQKIGIFEGTLIVTVGDDDTLTFRHERFLNKVEYKYLLDNIDPKFDVYKSFSVPALVFSVVSFFLSIICAWYGRHYFQPPDDGIYIFFAIVFVVTSIVSGYKAHKSKVNLISFNNINGQRLFSMLGNKPSEAAIGRFCDDLKQKIERIKYNGEISPERMAGILERHVVFLYEHQVLTEQEALAAIDKIKEKQKPKIVHLNGARNG